MKRIFNHIGVLFALLAASNAYGSATTTYAAMTAAAVTQSRLSSDALLEQLGVTGWLNANSEAPFRRSEC